MQIKLVNTILSPQPNPQDVLRSKEARELMRLRHGGTPTMRLYIYSIKGYADDMLAGDLQAAQAVNAATREWLIDLFGYSTAAVLSEDKQSALKVARALDPDQEQMSRRSSIHQYIADSFGEHEGDDGVMISTEQYGLPKLLETAHDQLYQATFNPSRQDDIDLRLQKADMPFRLR